MTDRAAPSTTAAPPDNRANDLEQLARERLRENRYLRADNRRLWVLLAEAVRYGAQQTGVSERALLEVLAETRGVRFDMAAVEQERRSTRLTMLLRKLEFETATSEAAVA